MCINCKIPFIPLGGGQRVGASCYYMQLAGTNIIMDAGTGNSDGVEYGPNLHALATSPYVETLNQIDQIYISHAHADHVGYLTELISMAPNAEIFMTEPTKVLTEFQLYDRMVNVGKLKDEDARLAVRSLMDRITVVSYLQKLDLGKFKVTFCPAGHIPGAMMVLFESREKTVLYTGDFSVEGTGLTSECILPQLNPDVLIMCGLHAKHPEYIKSGKSLQDKAEKLIEYAYRSCTNIWCCVQQLSKSVEVLKALNDANIYDIPIVTDKSVMNLVQKMEQLRIPILTQNNKLIEMCTERPHIYLSAVRGRKINGYEEVNMDFTLHEDFREMKALIKKLNPKVAVIVHCAKALSESEPTIEQDLLSDAECRTQFLFAEECEIYSL